MDTNEKMIEAAVNWWADKLKTPAVEGINGDKSSNGSLLALFARTTMQKNGGVSEEKILMFKELMTKLLQDNQKFLRVSLSTDYGPEYPLSEVCRDSGVSGIQFPQKTTMHVDFEEQTVTWYQVRGPEGTVWPK